MNCPRCGASDQRGEECGACGIVFARWRPREGKPPAPPRPVAAAAPKPPVNYRVVVPVVASLIIVGLIWAAMRGPDDPEHGAPGDLERAEVTGPGSADADEITDDQITAAIEKCGFFKERLTVRLPKSVHRNLMGLEDPRFRLAVNMGILELATPFDADAAARYLPNPANPGQASEVRLGPNATGVPIFDRADSFELDLGRRRVQELSGVGRSADKVGLFYRWTLEKPELRYFAPDHDDFLGGAELRRTEDGWTAKVWLNTRSGTQILCTPD